MMPIIRRALVTSTAVTLCAVVSPAVPAVALAQEAAADTPVGLGGRVEVVTAGYALTWPETWLYIRPTQADLDAVRDGVDALAPELGPAVEAALAGGLDVSLIAFGDQSDGLPESCNVLDRAADGRSVETIAQEEISKLDALGDMIASGPGLAFIELPAGRAARLDVGLELPEVKAESTSYIIVAGDWIHTMTCTDDERPENGWDPIMETFELLPRS